MLNSKISEIDQLLSDFDSKHSEKSASQKKEIAKDARIAQRRDKAILAEPALKNKELWEKF